MVAFYNQTDQDLYNNDNLKYMPQEKYRLGMGTTTGRPNMLDMSGIVSSPSGIMTQAPIIYPPINEGGGGGDGPPTGPAPDTSFDYETEAYGLNDLSATEKGLTEEEQEALDNQIAGPQLGKFGTLGTIAGMFTAPLTTINFHRMRNKKIEKELEEKTRQAGIQADFDRAVASGDAFYDGLNDGAGATSTSKSRAEAGGGKAANKGEAGSGWDRSPFAKGGKAGYFFGGRVNYKAGGRIGFQGGGGQIGGTADMSGGYNPGPGDTGGEGGTNPSDGSDTQFGGGNNSGASDNPPVTVVNNPPPTVYDNGIQVIRDQSKLGFNYPTGLTKNLSIGQLTAILDARKSLEDEDLEGKVQFDSSIGPVNTTTVYDTTTGPEFNASYTNNNFNANLNSKTGLGVNYSKDIGPGTFTMAGTYNPDGTYNTEAKYGISFANGGLASIL